MSSTRQGAVAVTPYEPARRQDGVPSPSGRGAERVGSGGQEAAPRCAGSRRKVQEVSYQHILFAVYR